MKHAFFSLFLGVALSATAADDYKPGPDSQKQPGVPQGDVTKYTFENSKIFPGTVRDYWIYVPKQYDPAKPACVYVNQDNVQFSAPVVFDNLIHKKEIPVLIGVFVQHGRVKAADGNAALDRFNRSYEYDGLGDNYARFILEELLPEVEKKTAPDGRAIRLSKNANDRAIGGSSSGAICAFTAAWERPDAFSRVFSAIGTFVGLRGGDRYPILIRKFEPKPLRIFLQDGSNDNNIYGGDWWIMNQAMQRSFAFAGYEHSFVWGDGGHNAKHSTSIFPDAMRYLWKDWPAPVKKGAGSPQLRDILIPGEEWQVAADQFKGTEGCTANDKGEVFVNVRPSGQLVKIGLDGKISVFAENSQKGDGQRFGPDGRLYAVSGDGKILAYDTSGKVSVIAEGFRGNDLVVAHNGNIYVTESSWDKISPSKVWLVKPDGTKKVVDQGLIFANGIVLSPDQTLLYVSDMRTRWVYSYQVQPDGTLKHKQRYYWLHEPDTQQDSGADGMRVDRDGRLYVTTKLGIQVCDQAGRVNCIIPTPNGRVSNLTFGGPEHDVLFATCGDRIYQRKVKVKGAENWQAPHKPAAPRL
ncbi:MAG: SMP-30/gluconolactonase/LRE family protein [Verrucomicrobiota bacterium]